MIVAGLATDWANLLIAGIAVGCQYALVVLGFVVIYRATGVINFSQGGFLLVGSYLVYNFGTTWGLPFYVSVALSMVATGLLAAGIGWLIAKFLTGREVFGITILTLGILIVLQQAVRLIWGNQQLEMGNPWGLKQFSFGDVTLSHVQAWTIGSTIVVLLAFFLLFKYSKIGVAMRATALDQEAALAQGISAVGIVALSWGIAGAVAALAGTSVNATGIRPESDLIVFFAFPAMILGGIDSPGGAVLGGLIMGIVQVFVARYYPQYAEWLGTGFERIALLIVMVLILMVRPYGLFGTREVHRV